MITKYETIPNSIQKPTEIQCDVCRVLYYQTSELDNFYHFYKDYDADAVFADSDSELYRESTEIEFDICQHCVKALLEGKLSNDGVLRKENEELKEKVDKLERKLKKLTSIIDSTVENMNYAKRLEQI